VHLNIFMPINAGGKAMNDRQIRRLLTSLITFAVFGVAHGCGNGGGSDEDGDASEDTRQDDAPLDDASYDPLLDADAADDTAAEDAPLDIPQEEDVLDATDGEIFNPPFPRLGSYFIGNPHAYDTAEFREVAARYHVLIVGQWDGWESGRSMTMSEVMQDIRAHSSEGIVFFIYINMNELEDPMDPSSANYERWQKIEQENWWLYASGTSGTRVDSTWSADMTIVNTTDGCPTDSDGKDWKHWYADWVVDRFVRGGGRNAPNPVVDGFFMDNVFWKPRVDGDWDRNGSTDSQDDADVQHTFREGYVDFFDYLRTVWPEGRYQIGNIADVASNEAWPGSLADYGQVMDGGVMEGLIGKSWSVETWGGFDVLMRTYNRMMDLDRPPKLNIFGHDNLETTDYQEMRYGLTACLMDDGYYFASGASYYPSGLWFDEFDVDLGYPTQPRQESAWSGGVWRRDFERGIVLCNPRDNGAQTVDLGAEFRKISGTQDPGVNDGSLVASVTLQDSDGIILLRP
jgi:hypothetical protein